MCNIIKIIRHRIEAHRMKFNIYGSECEDERLAGIYFKETIGNPALTIERFLDRYYPR